MPDDAESRELRPTQMPLRLSWDPLFFQQASAVAYGTVVDEWHGERLPLGVSDLDLLVLDGTIVGFDLDVFRWGYEVDDDGAYEGPRFWVPALGLQEASPGEILLAAEARWGWDDASLDAWLFSRAIQAKEESLDLAADLWTQVIDAGDLRGVFGLGYTLHDLGRFHEAHAHLRHYTELCPANGWAWCWYGRVLEALGDAEPAADAYVRAIELEEDGGVETDAAEFLADMGRTP